MDKTNELELNRWAHELLGNCWHINSTVNGGCKDCPDCSQMIIESPEHYRPDYCSSLDLAAIVESKAIEMVGYRKYGAELYSLLTRGFRDNPDVIEEARLLVTAPALTRVQAAMRAVEGK